MINRFVVRKKGGINMALIVCPECNKQISDRSKVCIHCGFPLDSLVNNPAQKVEDDEADNNYSNQFYAGQVGKLNVPTPATQQSEIPSFNSPTSAVSTNVPEAYTETAFVQNESAINKKKKILPIIIISAIIVLLIGVAIGAVIFLMPKPMTVEKVEIGEWTKNYDKEYGMSVTSEQKQPFVALIEMSSGDDTYEKYVYMENGEGEITELRSKTSENDELPDETARAIGFYEGKAVGDGYLKSIHTEYKSGYYMDEMGWTTLKRSSSYSDLYKMAIFTVETHDTQTGLLIYDVSTNLNKSIDKNRIMPIIKGKGLGDILYFLEDDDWDKNFDVKFIPRFFIAADDIDSDQYEILTNLNLDSEETTVNDNSIKTKKWYGTEKLSLKNNTSGLLLYKVTRTSGDPVVRSWMFENDYQEWYGAEQAKNKVVNIYVGQNFSLLTEKPEFEINIVGYLNYNDFGSGKAVLKENENDLGGLFGSLENEAQKQKEEEESKEREASELKKKEEEEKNYFKNIKSKIGADSTYCKVADDGSYMEIDTNPYDLDDFSSYSALEYIEKANEEMGFSESLYKSMLRTRALDGTQTEESDKIKVRWTYHPDNGMEVIYSKK